MPRFLCLAYMLAAFQIPSFAADIDMDGTPASERPVLWSPVVVRWQNQSRMVVQVYQGGKMIEVDTVASGIKYSLPDGPAEIKLWIVGDSVAYKAREILVVTPAGDCSELNMDAANQGGMDTLYSPIAVRWDSTSLMMDVQAYQNDQLVQSQNKKEVFSGVRMELNSGETLIRIWKRGAIYKDRRIYIAADSKPVSGPPTGGFEKYALSLDRSVGCPQFPICLREDLRAEVVDGDGPGEKVLELTTNAKASPGMFANAILHSNQKHGNEPGPPEGFYTLSGKFRKVPGTEVEAINVNISMVEDSVERFTELFIGYNHGANPEDSTFGWAWTRNTLDGRLHRLFQVDTGSGWHSFRVSVEYGKPPEKVRKIQCIAVDGKEAKLNLEMGRIKKNWPTHFKVLLETHNRNTGCDSSKTHVGKSHWDSVSFVREDGNPCAVKPGRLSETFSARGTRKPILLLERGKLYLFDPEGESVRIFNPTGKTLQKRL